MAKYWRSDPPLELSEDVAIYLNEEFRKIEEAFADTTEATLSPVGRAPRKLREGLLVNFLAGTELGAGQSAEAGLHVFRAGQWRKLVEKE